MPTIKSLQRLDATTLRAGGNDDNWHMTWANCFPVFRLGCFTLSVYLDSY